MIACCFADNNITGADFKTLSDRDMKDLIPNFLMRKRLRDWIAGVVFYQQFFLTTTCFDRLFFSNFIFYITPSMSRITLTQLYTVELNSFCIVSYSKQAKRTRKLVFLIQVMVLTVDQLYFLWDLTFLVLATCCLINLALFLLILRSSTEIFTFFRCLGKSF